MALAGSRMCRKLDGAEAVAEKWRAGPVLLGNTGQGRRHLLDEG